MRKIGTQEMQSNKTGKGQICLMSRSTGGHIWRLAKGSVGWQKGQWCLMLTAKSQHMNVQYSFEFFATFTLFLNWQLNIINLY